MLKRRLPAGTIIAGDEGDAAFPPSGQHTTKPPRLRGCCCAGGAFLWLVATLFCCSSLVALLVYQPDAAPPPLHSLQNFISSRFTPGRSKGEPAAAAAKEPAVVISAPQATDTSVSPLGDATESLSPAVGDTATLPPDGSSTALQLATATAADPEASEDAAKPQSLQARARERLRRRPTERFLYVVNMAEGMTSWYHALIEALVLARKLGRTFVEPCVRDGRIVACVPGQLFPAPYGVRDAVGAIGAFSDPLALPAVGDSCDDLPGQRGRRNATTAGGPVVPPGSVYPLHAYLNMSELRALYRPWIRFDEWWELEGLHEKPEVVSRGTRFVAPLAYCGGKSGIEADPNCRRPTGAFSTAPFHFVRIHATWKAQSATQLIIGRPETQHVMQNLPLLRADDVRTMFFFNFWRGSVAPVESFPEMPAFNAVHHAAVAAWIEARVPLHPASGTRRFAAFQWRSETIGDTALNRCSGQLSLIARTTMREAVQRGLVGAPVGDGGFAPRAAAGVGDDDVGGGGGGGGGAGSVGAARRSSASAGASRMRRALLPLPLPLPRGTRDAQGGGSTGGGGGSLRRGASDPAATSAAGARRFLQRYGAESTARSPAVLIADMPAPNNKCKLWSVYDASLRRENRGVVSKMLDRGGLSKYDADHPGLDSGVLSIRDFILATAADWLITCRGKSAEVCRGCFRANSYFTKKIVDARTAEGKRSLTNWFGVTGGDLEGGGGGGAAFAVAPAAVAPADDAAAAIPYVGGEDPGDGAAAGGKALPPQLGEDGGVEGGGRGAAAAGGGEQQLQLGEPDSGYAASGNEG